MDIYTVTRENIWNFRQNNPELVIQDARDILGLTPAECEKLRTILLARGVNKWLKVRRDLIAYKKQVKHAIKEVEARRAELKKQGMFIERKRLLGISKILQAVRGDLRHLCMTDRWQEWPKMGSHHKELKAMNSITASD